MGPEAADAAEEFELVRVCRKLANDVYSAQLIQGGLQRDRQVASGADHYAVQNHLLITLIVLR